MARGTSEHKNMVYLDIRGGKVAERVQGPGEGVVARTITKGEKAGTIVHERMDGYVEGVIKGWAYQSRQVAGREMRTLQITLDDVGERYVLQLPRSYKVWRHFILALPNVKAGDPVRFEPYDYVSKKDGKRKTGMGLSQNGEGVKWAFGRGDGKLPDAPMVEVNGQDIPNYTEQDKFLDVVLEEQKGRFGTVAPVAAPATEEEDDGMPF